MRLHSSLGGTHDRQTRQVAQGIDNTGSSHQTPPRIKAIRSNTGGQSSTKECEDTPFPRLLIESDRQQGQKSHSKQYACGDFSRILWPASAVALPLSFFTAVMLGLVYGYRLDIEKEDAMTNTPMYRENENDYIFVNFSATRLLFVTSWSSSIATILLGFVMALWQTSLASQIEHSSQELDAERLPTPWQFSLIINMATGSSSQVYAYLQYLFSNRRAAISPILTKTACIISFAWLLSLSIFAADTSIHYTTDTVLYRRYFPAAVTQHSFGRGIPAVCLDFNRTQNHGWPCTYDSDQMMYRNIGELDALYNNQSSQSEIAMYSDQSLSHSDILLLLPSSQSRPQQLDYSARTVGVSMQCRPMTIECHMYPEVVTTRDYETNQTSLIRFNCSSNFWGTLLDSVDHLSRSPVPNNFSFPPSNSRDPTAGLQYGYYTDPDHQHPYSADGASRLIDATHNPDAMIPDSDLINPVYHALAMVLPDPGTAASKDLLKEKFLIKASANLAYAINCSLTTYNVEYRWFNNSIQHANFTRIENGSVTEYFHGVSLNATYDQMSLLSQHALAYNTSQAFSRAWATAFSNPVMAIIGSVLVPRRNIAETSWEDILVSRLSKAALWFWVTANMLLALFGVGLAVRACLVTSPAVEDVAIKLSTAGVTAAAFEGKIKGLEGRSVDKEDLFEEKRLGVTSLRVGVKAKPHGGSELTAFKECE